MRVTDSEQINFALAKQKYNYMHLLQGYVLITSEKQTSKRSNFIVLLCSNKHLNDVCNQTVFVAGTFIYLLYSKVALWPCV